MATTNEQIRRLRSDSAETGDVFMVAVCDVALEEGAGPLTQEQIAAGERDYSGGGLNAQDQRRVNAMTHDEALALCVEAIRRREGV